MSTSSVWPVMGRDGLLGYVDPNAVRQSEADGSVAIHLTNGRRMSVPGEALQQQNGSFYLPLSAREIAAADAAHGGSPSVAESPTPVRQDTVPGNRVAQEPQFIVDAAAPLPPAPPVSPPPTVNHEDNQELVVPVVEERLDVDRRQIETGGVRVTKEVHERTETVDEPVVREVVNVERVAVNREVDAPPDVREEGSVVIIPVVEEMLVVQKRMVLREEVRVTRSQVVTREPQTVTLRREEANVQRWNHDEPGTGRPAEAEGGVSHSRDPR